MISKRIFKISHPEEGAKLKLTWCASNEIMDVDVVNGVVTVKKDGFTPQYVQVRYGKSFSRNLYLESDKDLTVDYDTESRVFNCTGDLYFLALMILARMRLLLSRVMIVYMRLTWPY